MSNPKPRSERKKVRKFLQYVLSRIIVGFLSFFPYKLRGKILFGIVLLLGKLTGSVKNRIEKHIKQSFPEKPDAEVQRLIRHNIKNLSHMANEFCEEPSMDDKYISDWIVRLPDIETHKRLLNKGGILVLGHLGNWETMGVSIMRSCDNELYVFSKRQSNPWSNAWIERTRASQRIKLIYTDESPRKAIGLLKQGKLVAFISDQDAGKSGLFFPFLGRFASTFLGPAMFSRMINVPVIFASGWYDDDGKLYFYLEEFDRPEFDPKPDPEKWEREFTYRWVKRLEKEVLSHPADYFWLHRRWHTKPENESELKSYWESFEKEKRSITKS
ncbi:lauroyl acyltransferase [Leptospira perolatii]|uniref:Lauroyl acyltransferase n=1 Tax=Leptospira perolatii TaxID=2023191 RepID=A0A2M9ZRK3_9LEPT|nr:lauroyl acyltransferase [Leptospira perolatii]PJZ71159.1 lauroyl acyltransferase [Leptospira perolatii]PJZ74692.1 lauroyl acyltransferase [Leptospira perolatii]